MSVSPKIIAAGVCAAAAVTGSVVAAATADAAPATHTVRLVVSQHGEKTFGKNRTTVVLDQVDRQHGKIVGYDVLRGRYGRRSGKLVGVFALRAGTLDVALHVKSSPIVKGTITGGSGDYRGAHGSITSQEVTKTKAVVVFKYTT